MAIRTRFTLNSTDCKIKHVVIAHERNGKAIACGAIKEYEQGIMEVKRMYTAPESRGKGIAGQILAELEFWQPELGYQKCIEGTGLQVAAIRLYEKERIQPNSKLWAICRH